MSKILHVVKEATGGFQLRQSAAAGEGAGAMEVIEYRDRGELESGLRSQGANDEEIAKTLQQLESADNADIRL